MQRLLPITDSAGPTVVAEPWMADALCTGPDARDSLWRTADQPSDTLCSRCPVRRECAAHEVVVENKDRAWDGPGRLDWELRVERKRRSSGPSFQARYAAR